MIEPQTPMSDSKILSDTIQWLRLPMIVLVVLLHTIVLGQVAYDGRVIATPGEYYIFDKVCYISQRCIGDIAVPLFFVISGYLFFNSPTFNRQTFISKIKRRVKTLLIPYLLWNLSFLLFIWFLYIIYPPLMHSLASYLDNFDFITFIQSFWSINGSPVLAPFWFVRDLIVLSLLSYPLYYLIKKIGIIILILLLVLWCTKTAYDIPGIGIRSLFFYSFGAYFSIQKKEKLISSINKYCGLIGLLWLIMLIADAFIMRNTVFHQFFLFGGMVTVFSMAYYGVKNRVLRMPLFLSQSSFFVFSFHMFIINVPNKCWPIISPVNSMTCSLAQVTIPIIVTIICVFSYGVLQKIFPQAISFFMGRR